MCPPAYLYTAPSGVVGDVSRKSESNVEPAMLIAISAVYAQAYGIPVKFATGGISQIASGDAATDFAGILVRTAPEISGNANAGFDDTVPNPDQAQNFLVRGYAIVKCTVGTPARGGVVYMRVIAASGKAVGDFEASSDGGNSVALTATQASWASDGKDDNNLAEIRVAR